MRNSLMMEKPNPTYKPYRFIIAGGGTGGHIFPAVAIAHALKMALDQSSLFIGAKGKMEMEKCPRQVLPSGFDHFGIQQKFFDQKYLVAIQAGEAGEVFEVASIMKGFRPDAVLGGGYHIPCVLRYAQAKGDPNIHPRSHSFAGKSNIMLGKKSVEDIYRNQGMEKFFPSDRLMVTGNPVRQSISGTAGRSGRMRHWIGLD